MRSNLTKNYKDHDLPSKLKLSIKGRLQAPRKSAGSTYSTSPEQVHLEEIKDRREDKVIAFQIENVDEEDFSIVDQVTLEGLERARLTIQGFAQDIVSSIRAPLQDAAYQLNESDKKDLQMNYRMIKSSRINAKAFDSSSLCSQLKTQQTHYTSPFHFWFSSSHGYIFSNKYGHPALRRVVTHQRRHL